MQSPTTSAELKLQELKFEELRGLEEMLLRAMGTGRTPTYARVGELFLKVLLKYRTDEADLVLPDPIQAPPVSVEDSAREGYPEAFMSPEELDSLNHVGTALFTSDDDRPLFGLQDSVDPWISAR